MSRAVASALQYRHVDTGAMYRAVAWLASHDGVDLGDEAAVAAIATRADLDLTQGVIIDGHDVTTAIRTADMDGAAARVSRHPSVRAALVARQREYGRHGGIVMEGRDIGTVVFPDADVKLYLDASAEERARRRAADPSHTASQSGGSVQGVAQALEARDRSDRTRAASPLTQAPDAIYIDTTGLAVSDTVEKVLGLVKAAMAR